MRRHRLALSVIAAVAALMLAAPARANVMIIIDKAAQKMSITVNGEERYLWPVSTGRPRYDTPTGDFQPFRMEKDHFSQEWDDAPMPNSIFFTKIGHAIHGTYEQRNLGRAVSHGCVRLSVKNATTLWELVKRQKMANTSVVLSGAIPGGGSPAVARSQPMPLTPEGSLTAAPDNPRYEASSPQYQPRYDDNRPLLPLPFFFGR